MSTGNCHETCTVMGCAMASKLTPQNMAARQKAQEALALRVTGKQWADIATELGYKGESGARLAASRLLRRAERESADQYKTLNRQRLEAMLSALWPKVEKGNCAAINQARQIVAELCKIDGSYAPAKVAPTTPDGKQAYDGQVVVYLPDNGRYQNGN